MNRPTDGRSAIVVGSGPNGLAAAVRLAQAGMDVTVLEGADRIGGGARSAELTVPGLVHDVCSAVHPFGIASPFYSSLGLEDFGLEWCQPEIDLAHPLDGARAGVMVRDLEATVAKLGDDGAAWRRTFAPLVRRFDDLVAEMFQPLLHVPRAPFLMARFGLMALQSADLFARRWKQDEARALFAGVAAHIIHPLDRVTTASVGVMMTAAGHRHGWPVAKGGSQSITGALAGLLTSLGGTIETGHHVSSLRDLPPAEAVLLDVSPTALVTMAGDDLPARSRRSFTTWEYGPAAYKLDLAVEGGIPWTNEACRRAVTVHVGGTFEEIAATEQEVAAGRMPERPFVLVAQQYLADPSRSVGDVHPVWTYAHVPHGHPGNHTDAILDQLERFAPGTRERVVGMHVHAPADLEAYNPNYVGGDIATGANSPGQVVFRPRFGTDPYATGIPGVWLCSAATTPGAGVHGMCGANAADRALRSLR